MRFAIPLTIALTLSGCAQVGTFTAADAMQAMSIAQAVGDTTVVSCYQGFATFGTAASDATKLGLLTAFEEKRALRMALASPACQPIYADVLAELLKSTPLGPFVP